MLAVALFTACGSDDDIIDEPQQPDGVKTYTLTVEATKGDDAAGSRSTRALSLDGKTLNAMWAQGEAVTDASTPSVTTTAANFENQQAIVRFKLMNKAGDARIFMSKLKISDGTHTYTVNRTGSADLYCWNHADCNGEGYSFSDALNLKNGIAATTLGFNNSSSHYYGHHATVYSRYYDKARPAGASEWSLPSLGQWNMIAKGLTKSNTDLSTTANSTFSYANIRSKVAAAGGWGFTWSRYWSTTQCAGFENAEKYNWVVSFGNGSGNVTAEIKDNSEHHYNIFVRPFFAF